MFPNHRLDVSNGDRSDEIRSDVCSSSGHHNQNLVDSGGPGRPLSYMCGRRFAHRGFDGSGPILRTREWPLFVQTTRFCSIINNSEQLLTTQWETLYYFITKIGDGGGLIASWTTTKTMAVRAIEVMLSL
jgi:hypothetical protein